MPTQYTKDPDAVLDYKWDWREWLTDTESITASVVTVSAGIVLDFSTFSTTSTTTWISGGTIGTSYTVSNRITTNQGRPTSAAS